MEEEPLTPRRKAEQEIDWTMGVQENMLVWLSIERQLEREYERIQGDSFSHMLKRKQRTGIGKKEVSKLVISPFEDNRVMLEKLESDDVDADSTYINASYIQEGRYIAAAMPQNELTKRDFWRMTYEKDVQVIVMVNRPSEQKVGPYWPNNVDETMNFGKEVEVTMVSKKLNRNVGCWIREFIVKCNYGDASNDATEENEKEEKEEKEEEGEEEKEEEEEEKAEGWKKKKGHRVVHLQYTDWDDMSVPDDKQEFVQFVLFTDTLYGNKLSQKGPMLVHCFGGVGRTGTFLTVHITLQKIKECGGRSLKVVDLLSMMRNERAALVQTVEQYKFCYRVILELYESRRHFANTVLSSLISEHETKIAREKFKLSREFSRSNTPSGSPRITRRNKQGNGSDATSSNDIHQTHHKSFPRKLSLAMDNLQKDIKEKDELKASSTSSARI